jgi:RimJ/RimL family protein N-acetyltransferase
MQPSDLLDLHILRTQTEVMKWTSSGKPDADVEATQIWMARFLPPNDSKSFNFSIEELAHPGRVIGVLGCHHDEPLEVGYMLLTEFWGKGLITESLRALTHIGSYRAWKSAFQPRKYLP